MTARQLPSFIHTAAIKAQFVGLDLSLEDQEAILEELADKAARRFAHRNGY